MSSGEASSHRTVSCLLESEIKTLTQPSGPECSCKHCSLTHQTTLTVREIFRENPLLGAHLFSYREGVSHDDSPDIAFSGWCWVTTDHCQRPGQSSFHPCLLFWDQELWVEERLVASVLSISDHFLPSLFCQKTRHASSRSLAMQPSDKLLNLSNLSFLHL